MLDWHTDRERGRVGILASEGNGEKDAHKEGDQQMGQACTPAGRYAGDLERSGRAWASEVDSDRRVHRRAETVG